MFILAEYLSEITRVKINDLLSIKDLRESICRKLNLIPEAFDLVYDDDTLEESTMINETCLIEDSIIHLIPSKRSLILMELGITPSVSFYDFTAHEVWNFITTLPRVKLTTRLVQLLLDIGCGPNSIYLRILEVDEIEALDCILKHVDINCRDECGFAVTDKLASISEQMICELIKRGLEIPDSLKRRSILNDQRLILRGVVNREGPNTKLDGYTLMWNAIAKEQSHQVRRELVELGADVNTCFNLLKNTYITCLTRACQNRDIDSVKFFLDKGAKTEGKAYEEAIILSIESKDQELIDLVIGKWNSPNKNDLYEIATYVKLTRNTLHALFYNYSNPILS